MVYSRSLPSGDAQGQRTPARASATLVGSDNGFLVTGWDGSEAGPAPSPRVPMPPPVAHRRKLPYITPATGPLHFPVSPPPSLPFRFFKCHLPSTPPALESRCRHCLWGKPNDQHTAAGKQPIAVQTCNNRAVTAERLYKSEETGRVGEEQEQALGSYRAPGGGGAAGQPSSRAPRPPPPPEASASCRWFSSKPSKALEKPFLPTTEKL